MSDVEAAVLAANQAHGLLRPGARGLVALSGGGDSVCLLHLLVTLRSHLELSLEAVHVDHGLRPDSADDAARAVALAETLGVRATTRRASIATGPGNLQERARLQRHELLQQEARRAGAEFVALGHTATDQAELVLMRAVRGAGPTGLAGMRWSSQLGSGVRLIRPLLGITRRQVEAYLSQHRLRWVQDPSNETDRYFRNRTRRHLLPLLRRENPRVEQALCRLAQICADESDALDAMAAHVLRQISDGEGIRVAGLADLNDGLLDRVLRLAHHHAVGHTRRLEQAHVEAVRALLAGSPQGGLDLPFARVERRHDCLVWRVCREEEVAPFAVELAGPGRHLLPDGRVITLTLSSDAQAVDPWAVVSASRARFPLVLRSRRAGDRIAIRSGNKKVSRVLMDARVPAVRRATVPLLVCGGVVVLVVGLRRAAGWAPGAGEVALVVELSGQQ